MNKTRNNSEQYSEKKNQRLKKPFVVTLTGVLIVIVALFLPYMTAVGDTAEYIEEHPDRVEIKSLELTASDLANIPLVSVHNLIAGVYGEDDGAIANVIVGVLGGCLTLTMLFVMIKKPIPVMFFDLLSCGVFLFLSFLMKDDFIDKDKYAWGFGYYAIWLGAIVLFAGAIWMLAAKISNKRRTQIAMASSTSE